MPQTFITITCGCNTATAPKTFTDVKEAQKHADETGHTLHGQITIVGNTR